MSAKIAIIYASTYGHVRTLAETLYEEVKASGAHVDIYRVPEILSEEVRQKMHAAPLADHPEITADKLTEYDGFLIGSPTRYGRAVASLSAFFDTTGGLWAKGALVGKFAGLFTSTASQHGGQETTALTTIPFLSHHGIIYVPAGYAAPELTDMNELVGGSAYGAAAIAAGDGSRPVSDKEKSIARLQAKMFSNVVQTYVKGKSASSVAAPSASESKAVPASAAAAAAAGVGAGAAGAGGAGAAAHQGDNAKPYEVKDAPAAPAGTTTGAESTPAAAPAATAGASTATPAKTTGAAQQQKKKGGFFASCCGGAGQKDNFDS